MHAIFEPFPFHVTLSTAAGCVGHSAYDLYISSQQTEKVIFILLSRLLGIGIAYLRLASQIEFITNDDSTAVDFTSATVRRINRHVMDLKFQPGRHSPLNSPALGGIALRMFAGMPDPSDPAALVTAIEESISCDRVVELAGHKMGVDEVLAGRAGLLALIIDLYSREFDESTSTGLKTVYDVVPKLVNAILQAGKTGAADFRPSGEEGPFPLMWSWVDGYYSLGA
jgi:hypothetical protein